MDYRSYLDTSTGAYVVVGVGLIAWVARRLSKRSIDLDGAPNPSWINGTGFDSNEGNEQLQEFFAKNYGKTAKYYGKLGNEAIFTIDPVAVHSVLTKDAALYKRSEGAYVIGVVLGGGLFGMRGETHRAHRKVLNPVFVHKHLREQMAIFDRIALETCDAIVSNQGVKRGQTFECDIHRYMDSSALEMIGQAGLGYSFGSFTGRRDEYSSAIKNLLPAVSLSNAWIPFLVIFKNFGTPSFRQWILKMTPSKVVQGLRELVRVQHNQAHEILSARKALLANEQDLSSTTGSGKDVLTLLMKSDEKLSADSQMSVEDMIGHMNTFIFAGHGTISGAVTRALDVLAAHPDVQNRLRTELTAFMAETGPEDINRDKIDTLPYLDAVCREVLRLFPPLSMNEKISVEDTTLPLKFPVKTSNGLQTSIFVPKGTTVQIGMYAMNRDEDVWGPDANQFDPERWLDGRTASARGSPGTYSHMMTFLAGPMACIGFKFAVLELKVLLLRLITRFKFERSSKEFIWMLAVTQAPYALEDANRPMTERKVQLLMNITEL